MGPRLTPHLLAMVQVQFISHPDDFFIFDPQSPTLPAPTCASSNARRV
jgi:hypothetical protein